MITKKELRKIISAKKRALSEEQIAAKSHDLIMQFIECDEYKSCDTLYVYLSYNQEVRTKELIECARRDGKKVAAPRVEGEAIKFYYLKGDEDIVPGFKGIPEPAEGLEPSDDKTALMLMPGLAFDKSGKRLGYGGGFYDRFLEKEHHTTVALCFDFQLVDSVPTEEYDLPVDLVIVSRV